MPSETRTPAVPQPLPTWLPWAVLATLSLVVLAAALIVGWAHGHNLLGGLILLGIFPAVKVSSWVSGQVYQSRNPGLAPLPSPLWVPWTALVLFAGLPAAGAVLAFTLLRLWLPGLLLGGLAVIGFARARDVAKARLDSIHRFYGDSK